MSKKRYSPSDLEIQEWLELAKNIKRHHEPKKLKIYECEKRIEIVSKHLIIERDDLRNLEDLRLNDSAGIDNKTLKAIDSGRYILDGVIDLHGYTQEESYGMLEKFILQAASRRCRLLLVITGRGGVLNSSLLDWLNSKKLRPYILRSSTAPKNRGGNGAFHIFLRRIR